MGKKYMRCFLLCVIVIVGKLLWDMKDKTLAAVRIWENSQLRGDHENKSFTARVCFIL